MWIYCVGSHIKYIDLKVIVCAGTKFVQLSDLLGNG